MTMMMCMQIIVAVGKGPSGSVMVRCSQQLAFSSKSSETSYKPAGRQEYTPCQNKTIENGQTFISSIFGARCSFSRTKSETYSSQSYLALVDTPSGFVFSCFQQIHKPISTQCAEKRVVYTYSISQHWSYEGQILMFQMLSLMQTLCKMWRCSSELTLGK